MPFATTLPERAAQIRDFFKTADLSREDVRRAIGRGLVTLWERQTSEEKDSHATTEHNGRGFNGHDARFGSILAEWYADKGFLSVRQAELGVKMIIRYSRQLAEAALARETVTA